MLHLEHKRTERSRRRFILMLVESGTRPELAAEQPWFSRIVQAVVTSTRETDIKGWYKDGSTLGVIFTEIGTAEGKAVYHALLTSLTAALSKSLTPAEVNRIRLSFHMFPERPESRDNGVSAFATLETKHSSHKAIIPQRRTDIA
jgi:hypothetical protein